MKSNHTTKSPSLRTCIVILTEPGPDGRRSASVVRAAGEAYIRLVADEKLELAPTP